MASCKNAVKKEVLTGKWELASSTITMPEGLSYTDTVPSDARPSYWTFNADGKLYLDGHYDFAAAEWSESKEDGTYTLSENHLTISTGRISRLFDVKELTADRLTVVYAIEGDASVAISFEKAR